jgi:hypothetical protein
MALLRRSASSRPTQSHGKLIYWDLESSAISQTITVGRNPVGLTLGLVEPAGGTGASGAAPSVGGTGAASEPTVGGVGNLAGGTGGTTGAGGGTGP